MHQNGPEWIAPPGALGNSYHKSNCNKRDLISYVGGAKAMSPVEIGLPSPRHSHFNKIFNDKMMRCELISFKK